MKIRTKEFNYHQTITQNIKETNIQQHITLIKHTLHPTWNIFVRLASFYTMRQKGVITELNMCKYGHLN